jgi:hypothetical protein
MRGGDLDVVMLLPFLGGAPVSMELGVPLVSELVSSAWCGAAGFGPSSYPPPDLVVRWWLEMAAGGGEFGFGLFGRLGVNPGVVDLARSTVACGATVGFSRRRRRVALWARLLRLRG